MNEIICGDCLDVMRGMGDNEVDLILTDPPYGIKRDVGFSGSCGFNGNGKPITRRQYEGGWDDKTPDEDCFVEMLRVSKNQIIFGGQFFTHLLPQNNHWIVWDKKNTMPTFGDCELAWTSFDRNSVKLFPLAYNGLIGKEKTTRFHPTQKPVKLFEWLLKNYAKEGDIIFDPFAGSAASLVACIRLGYQFMGVEKDPEYFRMAQERINKVKPQERLSSWF